MPGNISPDHKHYAVVIREGGKLLGRLTPKGSCNPLSIHAAIFSHAKATKVAGEINAAGEFAAKVIDF